MARTLQGKVLTIIQEPLQIYTIGDEAYEKVQGREVLHVKLITSTFEYIRSLTNISNPLQRLLISISIA